MANFARFLVNASPSSAGGFDATAGQALSFTLEGTPAGVVQRTTFQVYDANEPTAPLASKGAPTLVLAGATSGQKVDAATPGASVTTTMPSASRGGHSWRVRCLVNGGVDQNGSPSPDYVFERLVTMRSVVGLRKVVSGEATSYTQQGVTDAQNEEVEAGAASSILYALDFTAQAPQTLTSNGNYTIDGRTWTVENGANANSIALVNGTGLVLNVKSGTAGYGDNLRTSPLIRVPLTALIGVPVSMATIGGLRFLFRVQLTSATLDFQFGQAGLEWSGNPTQFNGITQKGHNTAGGGTGIQCGVSTSAVTTRSALAVSSDDVIGLVWRPPWTYDFVSAVYDVTGNQFPGTQTFRRSLMGTLGTNVPRDDQLNVFFAASPTGAASGFTATFTHMRIEQLP